MKNLLFSLIAVMGFAPVLSNAAVDENILVRGRIGNAWTAQKVKVTDNFDQTYYLPRAVFPKKFVFQTGKTFTIEITQHQLEKIELTK